MRFKLPIYFNPFTFFAVVYSGTFNVKRKLPLGLKLGLAAIAGGAIGFVAGSSSGGEGAGEGKIVEPPLPGK